MVPDVMVPSRLRSAQPMVEPRSRARMVDDEIGVLIGFVRRGGVGVGESDGEVWPQLGRWYAGCAGDFLQSFGRDAILRPAQDSGMTHAQFASDA